MLGLDWPAVLLPRQRSRNQLRITTSRATHTGGLRARTPPGPKNAGTVAVELFSRTLMSQQSSPRSQLRNYAATAKLW